MWFIGVEVEQETSAPPSTKNPGSAPGMDINSKGKNTNFSFYEKNATSASETTVLSKTPKEIPQNRPQSLRKGRVI